MQKIPMKAKQARRCLNCGKWGHHHSKCKAPKVPRCVKCGAANVKTRDCPCARQDDFKDVSRVQTLRRVGSRILRSVVIFGEIYEASFNISKDLTQISGDLYATLKLYGCEERHGKLAVPIEMGGVKFNHVCTINYAIKDDVEIGLDLLDRFGFSFSVGDQQVNNYSPIFGNPHEIMAIPIRLQEGVPPTNAMLKAVHNHNTARMRNVMEWEALPDVEEIDEAMRKLLVDED